MKRWLQRVSGPALDFLFPPVCPGCGKLGYSICPGCRAAVVPIVDSDCRICNRHLDVADICGSCNAKTHNLERVYAAAVYSGPLREAIGRLKYRNHRFLSSSLGDLLVRRLRVQQLEGFTLIPVPLHRRRKKSRGYNQSEILAKYVSELLDLPLDTDGLERVRDTESQVGRSESDRRRNVRGAFPPRKSSSPASLFCS